MEVICNCNQADSYEKPLFYGVCLCARACVHGYAFYMCVCMFVCVYVLVCMCVCMPHKIHTEIEDQRLILMPDVWLVL